MAGKLDRAVTYQCTKAYNLIIYWLSPAATLEVREGTIPFLHLSPLLIEFWMISNSNWTEWSTIQGVIRRVISNPWIVRHEVQLLINHNYNKIREEYDSGLNYLTGLYIQLLSYMPKNKAIQVQLARAWWRVLSNYSGMTRTTVQLQAHDVCNCTITAEIRPAADQSDSRILI